MYLCRDAQVCHKPKGLYIDIEHEGQKKTLYQEVHANNSAIATLIEATNATITRLRESTAAAIQILRENLHNDINGFQNKVASAFRKIEKSVIANREGGS